MKQINKAILVPIITATALILKYILGYEIPDAAIDLAADVVMGVITLLGILMHPMKKEEQKNGLEQNYGDHGPSV